MQKSSLVYMVCSPDKTTLYVGVTSDLQNRIWKPTNNLLALCSPIRGVSLVVNPYSATLTSTPGGDLRMSTAVGYVTVDIDSLVPGYTQTLSMVETGATATFDVSVLCLGTVVGSSVMNSPGTYNITFTPTTPTATIKIQRQFPGTPARYIQFSSMYLPRSDSSILENVGTTVCNGDRYQYGYNGQLKVNEIAGVGNHTTAKYWELDTRTGRRWNLDPVDQINISNYAVNGNNPILLNDPDGDCPH